MTVILAIGAVTATAWAYAFAMLVCKALGIELDPPTVGGRR